MSDSASYGKRQEYNAISELLKRNLDVFMTLVDDKGIDCVIRLNSNRYLDIQIKARSKKINPKNYGYFPILDITHSSDNYFFLFYVEKANEYWIIPSTDIINLTNVKGSCVNIAKSGKNEGKYSVRLTGLRKGEPVFKPQFEKYRGEKGFKLLK